MQSWSAVSASITAAEATYFSCEDDARCGGEATTDLRESKDAARQACAFVELKQLGALHGATDCNSNYKHDCCRHHRQ